MLANVKVLKVNGSESGHIAKAAVRRAAAAPVPAPDPTPAASAVEQRTRVLAAG